MKQLMKVLSTTALLAASAQVFAQTPAPAPVMNERICDPYGEFYVEGTADGDNLKSTIYANCTFKTRNDRFTLTPEIAHDVVYKVGDESTLNGELQNLRLVLLDKSVAKVGDWNFEIAYRYAAPVDAKQQDAGTAGTIQIRPAVKRAFGDFTFYLRLAQSLSLMNSDHTYLTAEKKIDGKTYPVGTKVAWNTYNGNLQFLPSYNITDKLSIGAELLIRYEYYHAASKGLSQLQSLVTYFYHNVEVSYDLGIFSLAAYVNHESPINKTGEDFAFYTKAGTSIGTYISKAF